MIDNQIVSIIAVIVECIGILLAERRTAMLLGIVAVLTIIIFFMT